MARAALIGTFIGFVVVAGFTMGTMALTDGGGSGVLAVGLFAGLWGGLGFGAMLGVILHVVRAEAAAEAG